MPSAAAAFALFRGPQQPAQPQPPGKLRIVSLAPSVTEILFALDLGDHIVGVTDQCNYPPAVKEIERVSGFGTPNVEELLALGPDMVIACGLEKPEFTEVLRQAGIQVVNVQKTGFIASFPELFDAIGQIGEATGRSAEAQKTRCRHAGRIGCRGCTDRPDRRCPASRGFSSRSRKAR